MGIFGEKKFFGDELTFPQRIIRGVIVYVSFKWVWDRFSGPLTFFFGFWGFLFACAFMWGVIDGMIYDARFGAEHGTRKIPAEQIEFSAGFDKDGYGGWSVTNHSDTYSMSHLQIMCSGETFLDSDAYVAPGETASGSLGYEVDKNQSDTCELATFQSHVDTDVNPKYK